MVIISEGQISLADAIHAMRLGRRRARRTIVSAIALVLLPLIFAMLAMGVMRGDWTQARVPVAMLSAVFIFYLSVFPLTDFLSCAAMEWRGTGICRPHVRRISAEGVQFDCEAFNVFQRWSLFARFRRSDRVLVCYRAEQPGTFEVFARSLFTSDADWQAFIDLVSARLPQI